MNLTKDFTLEEFLRSQEAARMGREIVADATILENLKRLCILILQPLRDELGRSIHVSSGYRPPWLNTLIGGASTSAHQYGCAADIEVAGMSSIAVCRTVERLKLPVDQCIHEFGQWCHVGIARAGAPARNEYLTARVVQGKTRYDTGLNA
jgi:zinc D-Ala-D-Ala carboxypeptidase